MGRVADRLANLLPIQLVPPKLVPLKLVPPKSGLVLVGLVVEAATLLPVDIGISTGRASVSKCSSCSRAP